MFMNCETLRLSVCRREPTIRQNWPLTAVATIPKINKEFRVNASPPLHI